MGADVEIFFKAKHMPPLFEWGFLDATTISRRPRHIMPKDATHSVDLFGNDRYYIEGYERGVWPRIAGVLMELFASEDVETVWYGSDEEGVEEITRGDVLRLTDHYMRVGCRPYRGKPGTCEAQEK